MDRTDWMDLLGLSDGEVPRLLVLEPTWWRTRTAASRLRGFEAVRELGMPDLWLGWSGGVPVAFSTAYGASRVVEPLHALGACGTPRGRAGRALLGAAARPCGAGDVVLPERAEIGEGVSHYYGGHDVAHANLGRLTRAASMLAGRGLHVHRGSVVTTGARLRQPPELLERLGGRRPPRGRPARPPRSTRRPRPSRCAPPRSCGAARSAATGRGRPCCARTRRRRRTTSASWSSRSRCRSRDRPAAGQLTAAAAARPSRPAARTPGPRSRSATAAPGCSARGHTEASPLGRRGAQPCRVRRCSARQVVGAGPVVRHAVRRASGSAPSRGPIAWCRPGIRVTSAAPTAQQAPPAAVSRAAGARAPRPTAQPPRSHRRPAVAARPERPAPPRRPPPRLAPAARPAAATRRAARCRHPSAP